VWTRETGFTILPQPPGLDAYRAIDINNDGVIAGDGGYDSGQSWRFAAGSYELLGTIEGDPISWTAGINENGDIAGTSRGTQFSIPNKTFIDIPGQGMSLILTGGQAGYVNNVGQVVGYFSAFRYTPGLGVEFLPPLGSRTITYAYGINDQGDVIGEAAFPTGNGHVPFIYTDQVGMLEIGNFGDLAGANSINNRGEVVGNYAPTSGAHPWSWSSGKGLRFLTDLVRRPDFAFLGVHRINEVGQILVLVMEFDSSAIQPALLTPLDLGGCNGDGVCSAGENCNSCPGDCVSGPGGTCGNGVCEAGDGEDCVSCPQDCIGQQNGKPSNRYCCGDGGGQNPVSCSDTRCILSGNQCTHVPAPPSCCGDAVCEGSEDEFICAFDCGMASTCGDGLCTPGEDSCACPGDCDPAPVSEVPGATCNDGIDNDCDDLTDCDDSDCAGSNDCLCSPKRTACNSDVDCCSGMCKGNGRCR
jgi:probable HAF family extracellular repeat protein